MSLSKSDIPAVKTPHGHGVRCVDEGPGVRNARANGRSEGEREMDREAAISAQAWRLRRANPNETQYEIHRKCEFGQPVGGRAGRWVWEKREVAWQ